MTDAEGSTCVFEVVICSRDRPERLREALNALDRQTFQDFHVTVIDQSDVFDAELDCRRAVDPLLEVIRDPGRGLSRSRNIGWRHADADWVTFVDDDCLPEQDWAELLQRELETHPEADFLSGHISEHNVPDRDYVPVATHPVHEERRHSGRWTPPHHLGFGTCMTIRRSMIERLGGWDERLGPGIVDFPAADDMDFNYRFLRAGGIAYLSPHVRVFHDQWRTKDEIGPLLCGYMAAHCGFSVKHLRTGDAAGGVWLFGLGLVDLLRMVASGVRRRSPFRLGLAWWKLRGLVNGTRKGMRATW
ncbi:MAG: glycosyltransferase family 2 protein [Acidimicrobiales bacterium]